MKLKRKIDLITSAYAFAKSILIERESGNCKYSYRTINAYEKIVNTIEGSLKYLDNDDRFIIQNEVIDGKKNEWYLGFLSSSTYYRHAKSAYIQFLNILENWIMYN